MESPGAGGTGESGGTILVLMRSGRDRELLVSELDSVPRYTVVSGESVPEDVDYDLCLVDEAGFERNREALIDRKRSAAPTFLPHALTRPRSADRANKPENETVEGVGPPIDRVFELPLQKAPFRRGIETLLYARHSAIELAEREVQYQRLLELAPEAILLVHDETVEYGNRVAVDLFGRSEEELFGMAPTELFGESDRDRIASLLKTVDVDEPATPFEEFEAQTDRGTVPVSVAGVGVHYGGEPSAQLLIRDLSGRKRREKQIDLFTRGMDAADQGITIADAQSEDEPLIYASEGFERITGYPAGEILGKNCRFLQGDGTSDKAVAELSRAIDRGEQTSVEILNYRRDGTPFWNQLDIIPVRDETGRLAHFLGLQRDVTERKLREQRLSVLNRVLRHNLRNNIGVVEGYARMAVENGGLGPGDAKRILDAANDLLEISEQVQRFGDAVELPGQSTTPTDLSKLLSDPAVDGDRSEAGTIEVDGPENVTVCAHHTLVASMEYLLGLLVKSAEGPLAASVRTDDTYAWIELVDPGSVFDDIALRVIERGTETPLEHLQGVELWLVKWSVEQSGGEISVDRSGNRNRIRCKLRLTGAD